MHDLLKHARDNSTLDVKFKRENVQLKDPKAATYPLLYMTGHHEFPWTQKRWPLAAVPEGRRAAVGRRLLRPAGLRHGFPPRDRQGASRQKLEKLPLDHPIYHGHYDIRRWTTRRGSARTSAVGRAGAGGDHVDGRLAVVYSKFDLGNGWEQFPHAYSYGYSDKDAWPSAPMSSCRP